MRAVITEDYGSPPTLAELDPPTPGPNEVRVRVVSSSLNGFDTALVRGYLKGMMEHEFPVIVGRDYAGRIDRVGDCVTAFAPGDDVFGVVLTLPLHAGGFADYLVVPEDHNIAPMPAGLDHATAGVTGLAGSAAMGCLEATAVGARDTVLVSGATGGVGAFILQIARARGARVIATAAGDAETAHVRGLGATEVVDYTQDLAAQVRDLAPNGVDVALHLAGDPMAVADLVAGGGRFASLLGVGPDQLAGRNLTASSVIAAPQRSLLADLAEEIVAGRIRVPVQRSYPLTEVPRAFADFGAGTLGKLAVQVDGAR
jgi:NADPH:quinone reductase